VTTQCKQIKGPKIPVIRKTVSRTSFLGEVITIGRLANRIVKVMRV